MKSFFYLLISSLFLLSACTYKSATDNTAQNADSTANTVAVIDTMPAIVYPKKDYTIQFPETATEDSSTTQDPRFGLLAIRTSKLERADFVNGNKSFALTVTQYPDATFSPDSTKMLQAFFNDLIKKTVLTTEGKILRSEIFQYKDQPCLEFYCEYFGNAVLHTKCILMHNQQYTITVLSEKGKERNAEAEAFFTSINIGQMYRVAICRPMKGYGNQ